MPINPIMTSPGAGVSVPGSRDSITAQMIAQPTTGLGGPGPYGPPGTDRSAAPVTGYPGFTGMIDQPTVGLAPGTNTLAPQGDPLPTPTAQQPYVDPSAGINFFASTQL